MSKRKKQLEEFFAGYEAAFNSAMIGQGDLSKEITTSFSDCFVESSPAGVMCGKNNDEFVRKLKQGFDFYKGIGSREMHIISKDISLLDDYHAIAKILWRYTYEKESREGNIDFTTFYVVNTVSGDPKIFAYIAGDEQKALREKGLIPENEAVTH